MMGLLRVRAPEALYPYARELVASLVARGGFPRLQLRTVDFEAIHARLQRETSPE
jgi:preprotein translocase subunit SecB